jgi:hypothetical protein
MLFDAFSDLNWLAVIVAGLAYFVLGALWYSNLLMGRQYRAALGIDSDYSGQPDPALLGTNLVGWLVAAVALGLITVQIDANSLADGLVLGLVVGVGLIGTHAMVTSAYEGRGYALLKVTGPYMVIGYAVMGVILAVWR